MNSGVLQIRRLAINWEVISKGSLRAQTALPDDAPSSCETGSDILGADSPAEPWLPLLPQSLLIHPLATVVFCHKLCIRMMMAWPGAYVQEDVSHCCRPAWNPCQMPVPSGAVCSLLGRVRLRIYAYFCSARGMNANLDRPSRFSRLTLFTQDRDARTSDHAPRLM